jgi:hypothetical protein
MHVHLVGEPSKSASFIDRYTIGRGRDPIILHDVTRTSKVNGDNSIPIRLRQKARLEQLLSNFSTLVLKIPSHLAPASFFPSFIHGQLADTPASRSA